MEKFIPVKKAAFYLVDRDAVSRVEHLFCYIRRFADEIDAATQEIGDLKEVYLNGLFEIQDDCIEDFFLSQLTDDSYNPRLKVSNGTVNGKKIDDLDREFTTDIYDVDIYVRVKDIEEVSNYFGIPKSDKFNEQYIKAFAEIESAYSYEDHMVFYPDEEEEFDELMNASGKNNSDDQQV